MNVGRFLNKTEFLKAHFLSEDFELLGVNLTDRYTQSIDADQVADIDGNRVTMLFDEYISLNTKTDEATIFTRAEMLEFVESW